MKALPVRAALPLMLSVLRTSPLYVAEAAVFMLRLSVLAGYAEVRGRHH